MASRAILSVTYFGPVQWYQKLNRYGHVMIERYDSFIKQTYRNRCVIATANGLQALTVPVERMEQHDGKPLQKCMVKDVRISNHGNWRHLHWNALQSAYGESPFFEYYADDLRPFFEKEWTYLYDFNMEICAKMCELLDIEPHVKPTDDYWPTGDLRLAQTDDYRDVIRPRRPLPDEHFAPKEYYQVYRGRHGFLPNLSVLDLLFNMGNESVFYL